MRVEEFCDIVQGTRITDEVLEMVRKLRNKAIKWTDRDESMHTRCMGALAKCFIGDTNVKVMKEELEWFKDLSKRINN